VVFAPEVSAAEVSGSVAEVELYREMDHEGLETVASDFQLSQPAATIRLCCNLKEPDTGNRYVRLGKGSWRREIHSFFPAYSIVYYLCLQRERVASLTCQTLRFCEKDSEKNPKELGGLKSVEIIVKETLD